jgi:hypothetical protein
MQPRQSGEKCSSDGTIKIETLRRHKSNNVETMLTLEFCQVQHINPQAQDESTGIGGVYHLLSKYSYIPGPSSLYAINATIYTILSPPVSSIPAYQPY